MPPSRLIFHQGCNIGRTQRVAHLFLQLNRCGAPFSKPLLFLARASAQSSPFSVSTSTRSSPPSKKPGKKSSMFASKGTLEGKYKSGSKLYQRAEVEAFKPYDPPLFAKREEKDIYRKPKPKVRPEVVKFKENFKQKSPWELIGVCLVIAGIFYYPIKFYLPLMVHVTDRSCSSLDC